MIDYKKKQTPPDNQKKSRTPERADILRECSPPPPPLNMSHVRCHMSCVIYHVHIPYIHIFFLSFILLFFHSTVQCSGRASWSCFSTSKEISLTVSLQASCQHSFHVVDYHRLELWTLGLWLSWLFPEKQDNLLGPPLILSSNMQEHAHP